MEICLHAALPNLFPPPCFCFLRLSSFIARLLVACLAFALRPTVRWLAVLLQPSTAAVSYALSRALLATVQLYLCSFFLRTILPNHPLTGNLVFSCHMVCLSICSLPSLLLSLIRPQVYCSISHITSLTFFLFAFLLLLVHLSPLSASPPTSRPLCPVAPPVY